MLSESVIFNALKHKLFILLGLLWICAYSFGADLPRYGGGNLYIQVPSNINKQKYSYRITTKFVNRLGTPFGCYGVEVREPGQIIKCEISGGYSLKYEDTLVEIQFTIHGKRWTDSYTQHKVQVKIDSDSVFYAIPELPDEETVDSILHAEGKASRKEERRENFTNFTTDWKSLLIYANFYQGNRPYGEISFSNARYNEVTRWRDLFSRHAEDVPGFIRGPVYGAEFNFAWRKNDFILGPKFGFQITTRLVNLGLSGVYYTDFTHGLFCIKPRIGFNPVIPWVNFSYEYAIRCGYNYFGNRINSHQFSVYFLIPLRLRESEAFL